MLPAGDSSRGGDDGSPCEPPWDMRRAADEPPRLRPPFMVRSPPSTPADMSHSADRLLKRLPAQSAEPAAPLGRRLPELSLASRPAPCRESPDPAPRSPLPCVVCEVCESPSVLARASGSTMLPVLPFLLLAMSTLLELEWPLLRAADWKLPGSPPLRADRSVRGCSRSTGAAAAATSARAAACGDSAIGVASTRGLVRWCGEEMPL
mmetsp:Transcript_7164/g.21044  ORF Transcript_7164/g.21044 Transcript_7164/m.21044 type:complete len:207 (-) Transcript_7164:533-1153(-)